MANKKHRIADNVLKHKIVQSLMQRAQADADEEKGIAPHIKAVNWVELTRDIEKELGEHPHSISESTIRTLVNDFNIDVLLINKPKARTVSLDDFNALVARVSRVERMLNNVLDMMQSSEQSHDEPDMNEDVHEDEPALKPAPKPKKEKVVYRGHFTPQDLVGKYK